MNGATEAKFDQFGPRFLQKAHGNMDSGKTKKNWHSYPLFWPPKLVIFDALPHFSGIEGRISRIEGRTGIVMKTWTLYICNDQ